MTIMQPQTQIPTRGRPPNSITFQKTHNTRRKPLDRKDFPELSSFYIFPHSLLFSFHLFTSSIAFHKLHPIHLAPNVIRRLEPAKIHRL